MGDVDVWWFIVDRWNTNKISRRGREQEEEEFKEEQEVEAERNMAGNKIFLHLGLMCPLKTMEFLLYETRLHHHHQPTHSHGWYRNKTAAKEKIN